LIATVVAALRSQPFASAESKFNEIPLILTLSTLVSAASLTALVNVTLNAVFAAVTGAADLSIAIVLK